jgi:hypothetical protein
LFLLFPADPKSATDAPLVQENNVAFQDVSTTETPMMLTGPLALYRDLATTSIPTPAASMARPYPVADITWSQDAAFGSLLMAVNFPDALLGLPSGPTGFPFLVSKITNFQYARHGVRLTLRVNGNRFLYGALLAAWEPATHIAGSVPTRMTCDSHLEHLLIFANSDETPQLDCPYHSPDPYFRVNGFASGCVGTLRVWVAAPLTSVQPDVATGLQVSVYAEMTDLELVGATSDTVVTGVGRPLSFVPLPHF